MDFKSLMAAQISKSKPPTNTSNSTSTKSTSTTTTTTSSPATTASTTNRYLRRSEVEAARIAAYNASQAQLEAERESRAAKRRKLEEDDAEQNAAREEKKRKLAEESRLRRLVEEAEEERVRRKRLGLPEVAIQDGGLNTIGEGGGSGAGAEDREMDDIPDDELWLKLREIGEPAVMWDEDHSARLKRWYKITASSPSLTDVISTTSSSKPKKYPGPVPTTLAPVPEADMLVPNPATTPIPDHKSQGENYMFLHRQISSYFTLLLSEWSTSLAARPQEVKSSQSGKQAYTTYLSVLRDLTPLYRKLESQSLPLDLLKPIVEIVHFAQSRRYVDANDGYLRLSIGKAAWPIGVTMVGIHERSAREKLHQDGRDGGERNAHIMSDEVTRKMLQSIKRCLSFAQVRWPPSDLGQLMG